MSDESGKKGFFARINEALYETVDNGEQDAAPGKGAGRVGVPASDVGAPAEEKPIEITADLATRVRADIEGRGRTFAQFLALAASFAEIIPEESGRYRAAMKALEKTGSVTRDQVLQASREQLLALQSQREVFAETVGRKREALNKSGGGAEAIRAQIAELQQTISRLQEQEQSLIKDNAAAEGKIKAAEERFTALLSSMEKEIVGAQQKIEKYIGG